MRVLVVEDESLVALDIEDAIRDAGHECAGIAGDRQTALALAKTADVAFVDLNLIDGATGERLAREIAGRSGMIVVYMTSEADALTGGGEGILGMLPKPVSPGEIRQLLDYIASGAGTGASRPPRRLRLFSPHTEGQAAKDATRAS